jgi:hypothetical protein
MLTETLDYHHSKKRFKQLCEVSTHLETVHMLEPHPQPQTSPASTPFTLPLQQPGGSINAMYSPTSPEEPLHTVPQPPPPQLPLMNPFGPTKKLQAPNATVNQAEPNQPPEEFFWSTLSLVSDLETPAFLRSDSLELFFTPDEENSVMTTEILQIEQPVLSMLQSQELPRASH